MSLEKVREAIQLGQAFLQNGNYVPSLISLAIPHASNDEGIVNLSEMAQDCLEKVGITEPDQKTCDQVVRGFYVVMPPAADPSPKI